MEDKKHLSLRIDPATLKKFRYVAQASDRSANTQLLYLVRRNIREFEKEHGEIRADET